MNSTPIVWLAAVGLIACSDPVDLPNTAPEAEIIVVEGRDRLVDVYYELNDVDGDDLSITIEYCLGSACSEPTAGRGGDGVRDLPTLRDSAVLHLFVWEAACDVGSGGFDDELVVQITPRDGEDSGDTVSSERFSLSGLGVEDGCPR